MEIWKDVVGYEGLYEVSNEGNVRTKEGKVTYTEIHGERKWKQRVLRQKSKNSRDIRFDLWKEGKSKTTLAHRIVAEAFLCKVEGKNCVNHIDGNPRNNNVINLEWCNYKENNNHAFDTGLMKTNKRVKLISISNGEEFIFRSNQKANEFIGRSKGYIMTKVKKGIFEVDGYKVELL